MKRKLRLAFVVQRYGLEVNGGAEFHCRLLAEHLSKYYDVEVITTCAKDYITWKNEYEPGKDIVNDIVVWRFPVDFSRDIQKFGQLTNKVFNHYHNIEDEIDWMKSQGPYSSKLLNFIKNKKDEYDYFIFFTYLYFPTAYGLYLVRDKAILIPTAHDEPPIYLSIFDPIFKMPKVIVYNTEEEKKFVNLKFKNEDIIGDIIGVGIQNVENIDDSIFKKKYDIDKFIIYVGRIDVTKECKELFEYFIRFKKETRSDVKLVLIGKQVIDIPKNPDIIALGFVSEQDKYNGIKASELLILPSKYESLSMVMIEAWSCEKVVLVNGNCEVSKGQCIKSNGGLYYTNYDEFKEYLNLLLDDKKLRDAMGQNGRKYVDNNYSWNIIEEKYVRLLDIIQNLHKIERLEIFPEKKTLFFRANTDDEGIFRTVVYNNEYRLPDKFDHEDIIIDVGCHIGSFSYSCLKKGSRKIYSYEVVIDNYHVAQKNLKWGIDRGYVNLYNLAVFRSDISECKLLITPSRDGKNTGGTNVIWDRNKDIDSFGEVYTIALDKIIGDNKVKLLKLDCEGSEYPILLTSRKLQNVDYICGEYHNTEVGKRAIVGGKNSYNWQDLKKLFVELGYRYTFIENKNSPQLGLFFAEKTECPKFFIDLNIR